MWICLSKLEQISLTRFQNIIGHLNHPLGPNSKNEPLALSTHALLFLLLPRDHTINASERSLQPCTGKSLRGKILRQGWHGTPWIHSFNAAATRKILISLSHSAAEPQLPYLTSKDARALSGRSHCHKVTCTYYLAPVSNHFLHPVVCNTFSSWLARDSFPFQCPCFLVIYQLGSDSINTCSFVQ